MKPRVKRATGQSDLFKSRLDQIIDMGHELVLLAAAIDWSFLEVTFGEAYSDRPGQPPLPVRLMAGLAILKHTFDLSDEELCARWLENPYFQHFCGEEFFRHKLPFDRSSMTRWRQRMGEEKLTALIQESLAVAVKTKAMRLKDLTQAVVDTTVQEKAIAFPTDAKLWQRARSGWCGWPSGVACGLGKLMRVLGNSPSSSTSATRMLSNSNGQRAAFARSRPILAA
jgi:IS5 family transposase